MPLKALTLKISAPAGIIPRGRGFYQLEEEELYVPVEYPQSRARFFSYLDSESVSFHLDRDGRLIFVEIYLPRRRWKYRENLVVPEKGLAADIRFLDFRQSFEKPSIICDRTRENLMLRFGRGPAVQNYFLAHNLIRQVNSESRLVALWISDITDDIAGKELAAWRKAIHGSSVLPARNVG